MSREKAQYKGDGSGINFKDISDDLRDSLYKCIYENEKKSKHQGDAEYVSLIVEALVTEARYMLDELQWQVLDITKGELQAEHKNLTKVVNSVRNKITNLRKPKSILNKSISEVCEGLSVVSDRLKNLSPEYDRKLGVDDDPLKYSDEIMVLANRFQVVETNDSLEMLMCNALQSLNQLSDVLSGIDQTIAGLEAKPKVSDLQHDIAIETVIRVMNVLELFDIESSATFHEGYDDGALIVQVIDLIGKDMRCNRSPITWRNIIIKAKKQMLDGSGNIS